MHCMWVCEGNIRVFFSDTTRTYEQALHLWWAKRFMRECASALPNPRDVGKRELRELHFCFTQTKRNTIGCPISQGNISKWPIRVLLVRAKLWISDNFQNDQPEMCQSLIPCFLGKSNQGDSRGSQSTSPPPPPYPLSSRDLKKAINYLLMDISLFRPNISFSPCFLPILFLSADKTGWKSNSSSSTFSERSS